jgi:hypothetical protein
MVYCKLEISGAYEMANRRARSQDHVDRKIEGAFQPRPHASSSFVSDLRCLA